MRALFIVPSFGLALTGCLGDTNKRLDGIEASTKILATEVQQDREFLMKSAAAIEKAANNSDALTAKIDTMNQNIAGVNQNIAEVNKNIGSVNQNIGDVNRNIGVVADSVKQVPGALDQVVQSTQEVGKSAAASEAQLKRVSDNVGVMATYAGVALTIGKEYLDQQATKAAAPAATTVAPPTVAPPQAPTENTLAPPSAPDALGTLDAPSEADLNKVNTSLLPPRSGNQE